MQPPDDLRLAIEQALRVASSFVERRPAGGWSVRVSNGATTTALARIVEDEWLELTAALDRLESTTAMSGGWPLLRCNGRPTGSARLALAAPAQVCVRADLFIGDVPRSEMASDLALIDRVVTACDDIAAAHTLDGPGDTVAQPDDPPTDGDSLVRMCGEAGWRGALQSTGDVSVVLETRAASFQATLSLGAAAQLRAVVPLAPGLVLTDISRSAIALLLLEVGAHIRMVKGVAIPHGAAQIPGIATACERTPATAAAIDRTLSALSVACDVAGREVIALQDQEIAGAYLALRGIDRSRAHTQSRPHEKENTPCLQLP